MLLETNELCSTGFWSVSSKEGQFFGLNLSSNIFDKFKTWLELKVLINAKILDHVWEDDIFVQYVTHLQFLKMAKPGLFLFFSHDKYSTK